MGTQLSIFGRFFDIKARIGVNFSEKKIGPKEEDEDEFDEFEFDFNEESDPEEDLDYEDEDYEDF